VFDYSVNNKTAISRNILTVKKNKTSIEKLKVMGMCAPSSAPKSKFSEDELK